MSLDNLPVEWKVSYLNDVIEVIRGITYKKQDSSDIKLENYLPVLRANSIQNGKILLDDLVYISSNLINDEQLIKRHDILVAMSSGSKNLVGKSAIAKEDIDAGFGAFCAILRPRTMIEPKYVGLFTFSAEYRNKISELSAGANINNLKPSHFSEIPFPIPPLAEQQEIVRQLDFMLAQVEQIKARLDAIPAILKKFRQSVLADAVSGKLTEEWREEFNFDIEAWTYERAEDLCLKVQSGSTPRNNPFDQNGTIPFLKVYNIVDQKISFDYKPQFILEEVHQSGSKRSICKPFDVLMNIVGPPLGKIAIVTDQYPEWNINQAITMFRVNPEKLKYKFLYYVLCEGQIVRDVLHDTKGSVGQINISLSQCRDALIPKPSLIEQDTIVERIDALLGMAEKIENTVQSAQKRVNLLTQSILAKAFSGELTAEWREQHQDLITGINSAESLLAKIQAEREASKPVKKTRAKKEA